MDKRMFMKADEVAKILGVSKAHAYKIIKKLNEQLKKQGYMTLTGKVLWLRCIGGMKCRSVKTPVETGCHQQGIRILQEK